jgi:hypothetical protein
VLEELKEFLTSLNKRNATKEYQIKAEVYECSFKYLRNDVASSDTSGTKGNYHENVDQ